MGWTNSPEDLIESAWGIIANAGQGDWERESAEWQEAAKAWRDRYHAYLDEVGPPRLEAERNSIFRFRGDGDSHDDPNMLRINLGT